MCCNNDYKQAVALKERITRRKNGQKTYWKIMIVNKREKSLRSIHFNTQITSPGYYYARYNYGKGSSKVTGGLRKSNKVNAGIHVYLSKKSAELNVKWLKYKEEKWIKGTYTIVPVICKAKDLIAVDRRYQYERSAVFTKVYISPETFNELTDRKE